MSFIEKDLGIVQTRDQELHIALFKSIKLQLPKVLNLSYIFESDNFIVSQHKSHYQIIRRISKINNS